MTDRNQTLHEVCAPLFLYLTTFRRNAATTRLGIDDLRQALVREFDRLRGRCERDPRLAPLFDRVHYALVATADQVVLGSAWANRAGWSMSLLETQFFGRAEGGKQFYRVVDEVLGDASDAAAEAAHVLFLCMGLGFQGELLGERKELENRRRQLFEKARLAGALGARLAPDSYGRNAQREPAKLPTLGTIRMVGIALIALAVAMVLPQVATRIANADDLDAVEKIEAKLEDPGLPNVVIDD